jgi:ATP-dependent DNA ligase
MRRQTPTPSVAAWGSLFMATQVMGALTFHRPCRGSISAAVMSLRERTRPGLGIIEPSLPSPAKVPPSGPGWIHEIKHDGFRILARREGL